MATDAQTLLSEANCFNCYGANEYMLQLMELALLVRIVNNGISGGGGAANLSGAGSPVGVQTPDAINQFYVETGGPSIWFSTGLTNADWIQLT